MEEVMKIAKKLEKMTSSGTADHATSMDLLNALKKQKMTLDTLQKTRIGMIVNNFRKKCSGDDVVTLSKALIKGWKKLLPESSGGSPGSLNRSSSTVSSKGEDESSQDKMDSQSQDSPKEEEEKVPTTPTSPSDEPRMKCFPPKVSDTTDAVRLKCRELLTSALTIKAVPEGGHDPEAVAAAIEEAIFQEFNNTENKYKTRVRSRVANLKDLKNPHLRENVMIGLIAPEKMAKMTSEEMASDELKELRAKLTKEAINDHQMSTNGGTVTDLFKCGKCQKRNCTYTQLQTRSSDEPMTTFVVCNNCGNRWKFC